MPTVLRWKGYRCYFFSNEGAEPAPINVDKDGNTVKYWLDPVRLACRIGFTDRELRIVEDKVQSERNKFLEAWDEYFGDHR